MSEEIQNTEAEEANENVELTVQDLATLRSIIDAASQRGAFKTGEMVTVGTAYNKLDAFLNAVAAKQQEGAEATADAPAEATAGE